MRYRAKYAKHTILIERTKSGFSASVPDLPNCRAAAKSFNTCLHLIQQAILFHTKGFDAPTPKWTRKP